MLLLFQLFGILVPGVCDPFVITFIFFYCNTFVFFISWGSLPPLYWWLMSFPLELCRYTKFSFVCPAVGIFHFMWLLKWLAAMFYFPFQFCYCLCFKNMFPSFTICWFRSCFALGFWGGIRVCCRSFFGGLCTSFLEVFLSPHNLLRFFVAFWLSFCVLWFIELPTGFA